MHATAQIVFVDPISYVPMELPFYESGTFHSAEGLPVKASDVIRYEPAHDEVGPFYTVMFRMASNASRADFTRAVRDIWSVCDADVAVAAYNQEETFLILPDARDLDCAKVLNREDVRSRRD